MATTTTPEPNLTGDALQAALAKAKALGAPPAQQAILDAEQLANASNIKLPPAAENAFTGLGVGIPSGAPTAEKSIQELYMDSIKDITPVNEGDVRTQLEGAAKIAEQEKAVRGLKEQIDINTAEATAAQLAQGTRQASMGAISGAQADIERKLAIRNLPLIAQYQAQSGNLQAAKDTVDKLFTASVADKKAQNEYKLGLINAAYNVATAAEKKKLDAKAVELTAKNRLEDQFIARQKEALALAKDANDFSRVNKIMEAKTDAELSAALSGMVQKSTSGEIPAGEMQLYSGLSSPTATAVRSQVSAFKTEPTVTNFNVIQEGRNFANSLPTTTTNPADDQALIYSLAKALDPNSVVREGEYATAQRYSQSFISSFGKGVEQALAGTGFLSETARKNIKATIESRYKTSLNSYNNLAGQYVNSINSLTGRSDGSKFLKDYIVKATPETPKTETVPLARGFSGSTSSGIKYTLE